MDLYSLVYGTMFALCSWVVREGYIGPEMIPWPIRMCWPQPSVTSLDECNWFQLGAMKSLDWIKGRPKDDGSGNGWRNIDKLISSLKDDKDIAGDVKPDELRSYIEEEYFQYMEGSVLSSPKVEIRTEYRKDRWLTYAPKYNILLRAMKNPYADEKNDWYGDLPVIAKDAFPLMDSIIGLGEFERGQTLQYALNSLWNLYLDGVKYSIFPPIHVQSTGNVTRSSIKWGAGEKWLMKTPGKDVVQMQLSPQGLNTFQSTYQFLLSAILNQAGTTDISTPSNVDPTMGRTPQAVRFQVARESARDEWDRVMMEEMIVQREKRWINMIVKKLEKPVVIRLFGPEAEQIAQEYPDMLEFFDEKDKYGAIKATKEQIQATYDFIPESGSTMKPDLEGEQATLDNLLQIIIKQPAILQIMREKGKDIDFAELMKRQLIARGVKDYDKIITEYQQPMQGMMGQPQPGLGQQQLIGKQAGEGQMQQMAGQINQAANEPSPTALEDLAAQIQNSINQPSTELIGGRSGIPVMPQE